MKPLLVIVEGPDRCGKGSFIEEFRDNIDTPRQLVIHSGKPPHNTPSKKTWATLYNLSLIKSVHTLSKTNNVIILDRSYLGEYVYGLIYRNAKYTAKSFNDFENATIKQLLNTIHVVLVNFTDTVENVSSREDGSSHIASLHTKRLEHRKFEELHNLSIINHKYIIDWSVDTFNKQKLQDLTNTILNTWNQINDN